jgi:hypothetical protein
MWFASSIFVWLSILLAEVLFLPLSLSTFSKESKTLIVMPGDCHGKGAMVISTGGKKDKCKKSKKSKTEVIIISPKKKKKSKKKKASLYFDDNYGYTPSNKKCKMVCF